MMQYREIPRESEMLRLLAQGRVDTSPLKVVAVEVEPARKGRSKDSAAGCRIGPPLAEEGVPFRRGVQSRFHAQGNRRRRRNRETDQQAAAFLSRWSLPRICPSPSYDSLQEQQVSGIDLSGNALILVPGEILVSRTGAPNKFRRSGVIKNVYRKNSSIVARVFLLKPQYDSITEVMDEIKTRGGSVTQATVSKVCSSLDQDLVIERTKGKSPRTRSLRLIQPEKLLELAHCQLRPSSDQTTPHRKDCSCARAIPSATQGVGEGDSARRRCSPAHRPPASMP